MFHRDVVVNAVVMVAVMLLLCEGGHCQVLKTATACFGNTNNALRLVCEHEHYIHVLRVIHAAKLKSSNCIGPFSVDTYRKECCGIQLTDCNINVLDGAILLCENKTKCDATATWSNTNMECDQDMYPPNTNYMRMEYMCIKIIKSLPTTTNGTTTETTLSTSSTTTRLTTSLTSSSSTTLTASATTTSPRTLVLANMTITSSIQGKTAAATHAGSNKVSQEEELSDAMIGAIVGGCLGMLLTFIVFVFYWGRKRRLRIVGKPQPSVWDYLLSQTFTVRGSKGYDHFSSIRSSSASFEGDPNSPVVRKNIWLPNIVDRDDKYLDDVISNYDNDSDRYHRVEIHHTATPSAYAILNLHTNNLYQDTNHEA